MAFCVSELVWGMLKQVMWKAVLRWNDWGTRVRCRMSVPIVLAIVAVVIPIVAFLIVRLGDESIAERHHSHHDTYIIAGALTFSLLAAMIFMGALGMLLGWLCMVEVFSVDASVVLGFFDAFLLVAFVYWLLLRRYKVVTYVDHMRVTPFFGRTKTISYADITAMEWTPSLLMPNNRNVWVYAGPRCKALLWSGLDLDQILIRIDRFDALENLSARM